MYVGLAEVIRLGGPSPSNTIALEAESLVKSRLRAPTNPISSSRVKATSTDLLGLESSWMLSSASSIADTPALQSPPKIVVSSETIRLFFTYG